MKTQPKRAIDQTTPAVKVYEEKNSVQLLVLVVCYTLIGLVYLGYLYIVVVGL